MFFTFVLCYFSSLFDVDIRLFQVFTLKMHTVGSFETLVNIYSST